MDATIVARRLVSDASRAPHVSSRVGGDSRARAVRSRTPRAAASRAASALRSAAVRVFRLAAARPPGSANAHLSPPLDAARHMSAGGNASSSAHEQTCSKRSALEEKLEARENATKEKSVFLCVAAYDAKGAAQKSAACVRASTSRRIMRRSSIARPFGPFVARSVVFLPGPEIWPEVLPFPSRSCFLFLSVRNDEGAGNENAAKHAVCVASCAHGAARAPRTAAAPHPPRACPAMTGATRNRNRSVASVTPGKELWTHRN